MFNLVCVHPFVSLQGVSYKKGQLITDAAEVSALQDDREHHFVRVAAPPQPEPEPEPPASPTPLPPRPSPTE
jgi:hypothetical protein